MEKYRNHIIKLTLCILIISFIPCIYNFYNIAINTNYTFSIQTLLLPLLNIALYYVLSFLIKNPKYLFKGSVDEYGNYKDPDPTKKVFNFTLNYFYIFRLVSIIAITYLAFQKFHES